MDFPLVACSPSPRTTSGISGSRRAPASSGWPAPSSRPPSPTRSINCTFAPTTRRMVWPGSPWSSATGMPSAPVTAHSGSSPVAACRSSDIEVTWAFVLAPQFYQTWWFYGLCALAAAGGLWGAWALRVRQLRRQFSLVLGERVRLSRELHDTLLQSLVGVALEFDAVSKSLDSSPAAAKERVVRIRERVEEYIREARRSIWSLR